MTVRLSVTSNLPQVARHIKNVPKQVRFATAGGINDTVVDLQKAQLAHMVRRFNVKRKRWAKMNIKRTQKATKANLEAHVGIVTPGDKSRSDIYGKFERDRQKVAKRGHLAVPVGPKRLTKRTQAAPSLRAKYGPFRGRNLKGKDRTFIIPGVGLMQRTGGGESTRWRKAGRSGAKVGTQHRRKSKMRALYIFKKSVPIRPVLNFVSNARRTVQRRYNENFSKRLRQAMRTAR